MTVRKIRKLGKACHTSYLFLRILHIWFEPDAPHSLSEKLVAKTIEFAGSLCHAEGFQT